MRRVAVTFLFLAAWAVMAAPAARGEAKVVVDRNEGESATADFKFRHVPRPAKADAASKAKISVVEGERDENGGDADVLTDGKLPTEEDQPPANFFFNAGTPGGRLLFDLGEAIDVKQVNTYSWHPSTRGPQVYKLYGSEGNDDGAKLGRSGDPEKAGWKLVAEIDTRPKDGEPGGQYGVSISDPAGSLGKFRYLLFEMEQTESDDPFGNTFYSEIDVLDREPAAVAEAPADEKQGDVKTYEIPGGKYSFTIDTKTAPELAEWADKELAPVLIEWYPKIVDMLPSEGYEAPEKFSIVVTNRLPARIPAATGGARVSLNAKWFAQNRKGEAKGAVVHELVHVVQQYGRARRNNANATRPPGWLVEGIPDYIRWFLYEPQTHGAEIPARAVDRVHYNDAYRVSANFLNFVTHKYDKDLVKQLNVALREGKYSDELFEKLTGKPLDELSREWKANLGQSVAAAVEAPAGPQVEVAIVGCAHIHTPDFEARLKKRHDVKVKTVWDHDPERAKANAQKMGVPVAESLEQIWNDPEIKAVIICSETIEHLPLVTAAVKAKKEIYAEKPLGVGAKDAYEMAKEIDDAHLLFQTGYFMRGDPKVLFLKEQAEKGNFGHITRIRGSNTHNGALGGWFDKDWRWMADPKQAGVGAYGDLGTHSLDLMLWIMNEPVTRVTATTSPGTARYEGCDELGEGILIFKDGTIGTLAAGWDDVANPVTLEIAGTEGHATIVNDKLYFQSSKVEGADGKQPWTKLPEPMTHPFERFLDAVAGKKDAVLISADEAAYRAAVMEALYEAARGQKWAEVQQPPGK